MVWTSSAHCPNKLYLADIQTKAVKIDNEQSDDEEVYVYGPEANENPL